MRTSYAATIHNWFSCVSSLFHILFLAQYPSLNNNKAYNIHCLYTVFEFANPDERQCSMTRQRICYYVPGKEVDISMKSEALSKLQVSQRTTVL